jgi:cytochrome b561
VLLATGWSAEAVAEVLQVAANSASGVFPTRGAASVPAPDQGPAPSAARCLCDERYALSVIDARVNVSVWALFIAATTKTMRMLRNTRERWGLISQLLHWLVAVLILVQVGVGVAAVDWRLSPTKLDLFVWHKSVGMLILLLVLLRLGWRITNPTPAPPPDMRPWEVHAAQISHVLLYLFVLGLPLTGWIINSAANIPLKLFWLVPLPDITAPSKPLQEAATGAHVALVIALAALLVVHVGAALRHHYLKHNAVLRRMLPWTRPCQ